MNYADILVNIRRIVRSVNLESKRIEKEYGISIPQLLALGYLRNRPDCQASHKDIKDFLKLNASTVTGIIARLEKKNLIARLPRFNDKRVSLITLTAQGAELLEAAPQPLHQKISEKLQKLSPQELARLNDAFQSIIDILSIDGLAAEPLFTGDTQLEDNNNQER
ncbi:MAG: MarR family transcriptional regulator [Phaeodactylibacter sp.]|nr:MarR family transcriptional regulator [Phaeodactylibacter sp.]MCB9272706.1 MarR family transcriptional regulator [Lewinellaceae bacterium]